jgi:dolichol kinase
MITKKYSTVGRKFLHIMVGNVAFLLPIFQTKEIMAFVAAGPFILLTFIMSTYSPIKSIRIKISKAGHGLGLVYYAIAWTILAYIFFEYKEIIAIGMLTLSYGDGFAFLIGNKYGKKKNLFFKESKSYLGTLSMFIFTIIAILVSLYYYNISLNIEKLIPLLCISGISSLVERYTPLGLDNLSIPLITALLYWMVFVI